MEDIKEQEDARVPMEVDSSVLPTSTSGLLDSTAKPSEGVSSVMEVVMEGEDESGDGDDGTTPVKRLEAAFGAAKEDAPCLQVVVRVRPVPKEKEQCTEVISDCKIRTTVPDTSVSYKLVGPQVKEYTFNRVFSPDSAQEELYKGTTEPLVDALYMGRSGLLFAYGVTNAGKTFTIMGNEEHPGILPRALGDIFARIKRDEKTTLLACRQCAVVASYLEVYNDQIFDLLDESNSRKALKPADRGGRIEVKGLSKHEITDVQSGLNLVRQGAQNRQKAATRLNIDSSRSHSVFTIELVSRPMSPPPGNSGSMASSSSSSSLLSSDDMSAGGGSSNGGRPADIVGTLWIVDLAGSERSARTGHSSGKLQREASGINTSLMKLWRCLDQLRKNQSGSTDGGQQLIVPFRECKITHLFMNHLTGASVGRTVMILNVNPSKDDYDETAHVLNQGSGAQEIRVIKDFKREMRHRQLLGGTHDYDGRRILKRRKSQDKERGGNGDGKGGGGGGGRGGQGGAMNVEDDGDEDEDLSGVESDTALTTTGRKSIVIRHWRNVEEENLRMKDVEEENRVLRETIESLKDKLCTAETQIREEVAEEMAQRMSVLEEQVRAFREGSLVPSSEASARNSSLTTTTTITTTITKTAAVSGSTGTRSNKGGGGGKCIKEGGDDGGGGGDDGDGGAKESCLSARKIYQGRLEKRIAEMEDQKQEAEEEMARMRNRHDEELARLRARIQELMEREEDRDSLDAMPGIVTVASLQEELDEVKKELAEANAEAAQWKERALTGTGAAGAPQAPNAGGTPGALRPRKRSKSAENTKTPSSSALTAPPPPTNDSTEAANQMSVVSDTPTTTTTATTVAMDISGIVGGGNDDTTTSSSANLDITASAKQPPPPPASPASSSASKASDDRRLKIQERIRQQIKPKLESIQLSAQEDNNNSSSNSNAAAARTPIALRLRSRQPAGAAPPSQQQPTE